MLLLPVDETAPLARLEASAKERRICLSGTVMAAVEGTSALSLELSGGVTLQVEADEQTCWLPTGAHEGGFVPPLAGTEVHIMGEPSDTFANGIGGHREPALAEHRLQASLIATGDHAGVLLQSEVETLRRQHTAGGVELPQGEPPFGVRVQWDEPHPGTRRLFLLHQVREPKLFLRGPFALLFAGVAMGLLILITNSPMRAMELFNAGAPWIICSAPFLIFMAVMASTGGRRIILGGSTLRWDRWPLPWWPGSGVPAADVVRIYREEGTLLLELRDGSRRTLLPRGTPEQLDYLVAAATEMLLHGPGPWIEQVAEGESPGRLLENLVPLLLLLPGFGALLLARGCPWE